MKKKNVLITGGAGFVGSHLTDELIKMGYHVVIVDTAQRHERPDVDSRAVFYTLDVRSKKIGRVFKDEKINYVFHLAAQINARKSIKKPVNDIQKNIIGALNVLDNCRKYKVEKIVFPSTAGIYGNKASVPTTEESMPDPDTPYGINKLAFEHFLSAYHKMYGLPYVIFRIANIFGPRQFRGGGAGVISIIADKIANNKEIVIYGDGKQTRDFIYIDDVVGAMMKAMKSSYIGTVNIGTGKEESLLDVIDAMKKASSCELRISFQLKKKGEQLRSCLDPGKAKQVLDWQAKTNFEEGIKKILEWHKNLP